MNAIFWGILLAGRIFPAIWIVPFFGGRSLPSSVKIVLAVLVVVLVLPTVDVNAPAPEGAVFLFLLLKELAVGAMLSLAGSCLFEVFRIGGELNDHLRGASTGTALALGGDEHTSALGQLYTLLGVAAFFAVGGPVLYLRALGVSLQRLPLASFPGIADGPEVVDLALALTGEALRTGIAIAAPAGVALLVTDVCLGFLNRAAPALQVFFLGMPLKAALGIVVVAATLDRSFERALAALLP